MKLPRYVTEICDTLEKAGFSAYVVGGSVRDMLLSKTPSDYDVATSARPEETKKLFSSVSDTGEKHGTIGVRTAHTMVEVTTFREDGTYSDHRRPDAVQFVSEIDGDLARRDFTINAMAYHPVHGLIDLYGGQADLKHRLIRTVGTAERRFEEDALRILRCFRFAAQLGFKIEEKTYKAACKMAETLQNVHKERIFAELSKTISAADADLLQKMIPILAVVLPEALPLSAETAHRTAQCADAAASWAILCGKKTEEALLRIGAPRVLRLAAKELADYVPGKYIIADIAALRYNTKETLADFLGSDTCIKAYKEAAEKGYAVSPAELAVGGKVLFEMGFRDAEIGRIQNALFLYVLENPAKNNKECLKEAIEELCKERS